MRLAVLASGGGSNLQALLDADDLGGGEVVVVGSDRAGSGALARAEAAGIPQVLEEVAGHPGRVAWETALTDRLLEHAPDAVVLAGFMRIVSTAFLARWPDRVLNTHPSLLPAFPGAYAVRDALAHGVRITGVTVHLVDEHLDHGPIVAQRPVRVLPGDDEAALHERIRAVEHEVLPRCVRLLCRGELRVEGRRVLLPADPGR